MPMTFIPRDCSKEFEEFFCKEIVIYYNIFFNCFTKKKYFSNCNKILIRKFNKDSIIVIIYFENTFYQTIENINSLTILK